MDLICQACGEDEIIDISTFGDYTKRHMCVNCGSHSVARVKSTNQNQNVAYRPPSVSQMTRRLRSTEGKLSPSAMECAIAAQRWEEDAAQWRDDLVALLSELEPE